MPTCRHAHVLVMTAWLMKGISWQPCLLLLLLLLLRAGPGRRTLDDDHLLLAVGLTQAVQNSVQQYWLYPTCMPGMHVHGMPMACTDPAVHC